jgi:hypothetical protein
MDHQTALAQNRAALLATIRFGQRKLGPPKWEPAPDSEAAAEVASAEIREDGSPWGEDPLRTAYAAANLMTHAVIDNPASLHELLAGQMPATATRCGRAPASRRAALRISAGVRTPTTTAWTRVTLDGHRGGQAVRPDGV